jgi:DME family drug/metabolite transporter
MIGELAALGAAISWTASAILYGKALQQTTPIPANIVRLSCTSAVLLLVLAAAAYVSPSVLRPQTAVLAALSGIVGLGLGDTLYMVSLKHIGVTRAVPITCTYPLFNLVWAAFLIGEKPTLQLILGALIIFLGVWFLSHENKTDNQRRSRLISWGVAAALAAAILWSISIATMDIAIKQTPRLSDAFVINTIRTAATALLLLTLSPIIDRQHNFVRLRKKTTATLILGGLIALGVGWFLLAYSFLGIPESQAVPISSTTPLFSTLIGVTLLREKVTPENILGAIIVVAGIFLVFLA